MRLKALTDGIHGISAPEARLPDALAISSRATRLRAEFPNGDGEINDPVSDAEAVAEPT